MTKQKKFYALLGILIFSFFLNLFWEVSHSILYNWNIPPLENNIYFFIPKILFSTLGDVMYIGIMILLISLFNRDFNWIINPKKRDYTFLAIFGILFAIFIEAKAILFNSWQYNEFMPIIFGIGLTPLIQLSITSIATLFLINKFVFRKESK